MEWNLLKFKVLGIWFTDDLDNCEKNNYSEKFAEVLLLRIWMERLITPLGRVAILKSLVLRSLYTYGFCYQTHQMNTSIVYKNCAMNLYGIKSRTRLIEKQFIKAYKKEALVFHI